MWVYNISLWSYQIHKTLRKYTNLYDDLTNFSFESIVLEAFWRSQLESLLMQLHTPSSSSSKSPSSTSQSSVIISMIIVIIEGHLVPKDMLTRCHQVALSDPPQSRNSGATYQQLEQTMFGLKWRQNFEQRTLFIIWFGEIHIRELFFQIRLVMIKIFIFLFFTGSSIFFK